MIAGCRYDRAHRGLGPRGRGDLIESHDRITLVVQPDDAGWLRVSPEALAGLVNSVNEARDALDERDRLGPVGICRHCRGNIQWIPAGFDRWMHTPAGWWPGRIRRTCRVDGQEHDAEPRTRQDVLAE